MNAGIRVGHPAAVKLTADGQQREKYLQGSCNFWGHAPNESVCYARKEVDLDIRLHGITTAVPAHRYPWKQSAGDIAEWTRDPGDQRLSRIAHKVSGIETRYSVLPSISGNFFRRDDSGNIIEPTTGERNTLYKEASVPLICDAVQRLFTSHPFTPSDITHLITVSCTGFFCPGFDYHIVRKCGLRNEVQRYHLGFMGCYAALSALHLAQQLCEADPQAVVLIADVELCSLHLKPNAGRDAILANALFADGAAACLISAKDPGIPCYRLHQRSSRLVHEGEAEMAWDIGDLGFDMVLTSYVPKLIGANIRTMISEAFNFGSTQLDAIDTWAVHPGGKAILDEVEKALGLEAEQLVSSREVLRNYGNMSSATVLFVLKDLLERSTDDQSVCSMAFGPGLTVELYLMDLIAGRLR
jgi:predicted naringenin-chalcone synthase